MTPCVRIVVARRATLYRCQTEALSPAMNVLQVHVVAQRFVVSLQGVSNLRAVHPVAVRGTVVFDWKLKTERDALPIVELLTQNLSVEELGHLSNRGVNEFLGDHSLCPSVASPVSCCVVTVDGTYHAKPFSVAKRPGAGSTGKKLRAVKHRAMTP
jgi:hypothetical protein